MIPVEVTARVLASKLKPDTGVRVAVGAVWSSRFGRLAHLENTPK